MRRAFFALAATLALCLPCAALSGQAAQSGQSGQTGQTGQAPDKPAALNDVLTYIRLFGYKEMLQLSVERQLAAIVDYIRQERADVAPETLDLVQKELKAELDPATERSLVDMAKVFQRHLTQADVDYLNTVGRDPRMQKVVRLQPKIAVDLEQVGEKLADDVYRRAAPRIEERLSGVGEKT